MLCQSKEISFDHPDWIFENKYDGFRAIAQIENTKCKIYSRNKLQFENVYIDIKKELECLPENMILDGEIAIEDENENTNFQLLQNYHVNNLTPKYYVFDILYLNGYNLMNLPLIFRKEILESIFKSKNFKTIKISPYTREKGIEFYNRCKKNGSEGIIAKYALGTYLTGERSSKWLKIKSLYEQEAVIVGFTEPKGERLYFGSIILAIKEYKTWKYVGHCGTGFNFIMLENLFKQFLKVLANGSPFKIPLKMDSKIHWLKPKLVCQIKFNEWTEDRIMSQPTFLGLRTDKKSNDVRFEINERSQ
jgi:bifunctional non-homologous end joining protein LigD